MKKSIAILAAVMTAVAAFADGGVFPPPGVSIYEPYQYAVIEHDGSTENLHLLIRVEGEPTEFGWIVPLPSTPEITEDTISLFEEIMDMTNPDYGYGFGCMGPADRGGLGYNDYEHIEIIEEDTVGILKTTTLSAQDPAELFTWLRDNGFPITDTTDTSSARDSLNAVEIFADYISRDWIFVIFTIDELPDRDANLQPVEFTFNSPDIVYPMKITSLNKLSGDYYYYYYLELYLFVIADHRMKVDTGCGEISYPYVNKISESEYEAITEHYPQVACLCGEGDFITRIEATFWDPEDIDADYVMVAADNDSETFYGHAAGGPGLILLPLAFVFGTAAFVSRRLRKKKKR
ncbi:DUF2330 domain-containing protein [candidate division WOR-3 bacterium]|uniref:DUF2330 domain-containing protein n=1 Tax=candidate division WOR-3 bacterium TaxID=2052148 RepID=A0A9D5KD48_UNCW3|nr:DUF2330 domain-containing protein [candidate division WOR-3 bacterium]MBD3365406.1 DUF2330 domain-containing protein [candidate division WOR-3 bacterium]